MTSRGWFRVHSFTGVITGLLLFFVCWTGTVATVSHEIDWLVTPEARVQPDGEALGWEALVGAVKAAYPVEEIHFLTAPLYERSAAEIVVDLPEQRFVRVYVDPYTGKLQGARSAVNLQRIFRDLHRRLFIPGSAGILLVSAFGLTLLVSFITPLIFYKRWWRRFFSFRAGSPRALWSELHKLSGLWGLWFVAVIAITGVWYGIEALKVVPGVQGPGAAAEAEAPLPLDRLLASVRAARPDLRIETIVPPGGRFGGALYAEGQTGSILVRDRANHVMVGARDGSVLTNYKAGDGGLYVRWTNTADPLHFGDFGGLVSKAIWFVFGVALSGLCLTGAYLHVLRLSRAAGRPTANRWSGMRTVLAGSLMVVLASLPLGYLRYRAAGPVIDGTRHLPELAPGVTAFLALWVLLTLAVLLAWIVMLWRAGGESSRQTALGAQRPKTDCV
ncbi:PepSY domain-containing protein [Pelagibius sp.]|uniref:PepSY-associated TM helix domain-containing protein n=1 Tax=Pelagibius sp. TaxID=1931238 RepID=UPI00262D7875|nr:PepSY-associated TM helix domain-containing protein [Pelagibius sp.]